MHRAAAKGHNNVVTQILAACPEAIHAVDFFSHNALHRAIIGHQLRMTERLLTIEPALIYGIDEQGMTALHLAIGPCCDPPYINTLWQANPQALHIVDKTSQTPFDLAVHYQNHDLIELFEGSVSFDEIVSAFTNNRGDFQESYKPVIQEQCESLSAALSQDVVPLVLEYLGFEAKRRDPKTDFETYPKRTKEGRIVPECEFLGP